MEAWTLTDEELANELSSNCLGEQPLGPLCSLIHEAANRLRVGRKNAPEQPTPAERPASLREVWAAIDGLRESLETAWEANELHEALLRALRNAVVMTPIEQRDLDPVLHAMDAIDARWRERGRE